MTAPPTRSAWAPWAVAGVAIGLLLATVVLVLAPVVGRGSDLAVAGATLVVAAAFQPAGRSIQAAVDRRFNRARYDAPRTVAVFSTRLRDAADLDELPRELVGGAEQTVEPPRASLWRPTTEARR